MYNTVYHFQEDIKSGFNPELKPWADEMVRVNERIYNMRRSGTFSSEYIRDLINSSREKMKAMRDAIYQARIDELERKQKELRGKFVVNLSDSEVSRKILEIKQFENSLKLDDHQTLVNYIAEFRNGTKAYTLDQLNAIGAELRSRGKDDDVWLLSGVMKEKHVYDPWQNDPEYKKADYYLSHFRGLIGANYISLDTVVMQTEGIDKVYGGKIYPIDELVG